MEEFIIGNKYRVVKGVYQHCSGEYGRVYFHKNSEFILKEIHNVISESGCKTKLLMEHPEESYKVFVDSNIVTTPLKALRLLQQGY